MDETVNGRGDDSSNYYFQLVLRCKNYVKAFHLSVKIRNVELSKHLQRQIGAMIKAAGSN